MKFCKNLQRIVNISDPEWAPYWTNYKMLKKIIKELPSLVPTDDAISHTDETKSLRNAKPDQSISSIQQTGNRTKEADSKTNDNTAKEKNQTKTLVKNMGKSTGEIAFFKLLHAEFKKVSHFFELAQQEHAIREERVREGMEIMKRSNFIMVNDKWSSLAKSVYKLHKDLLLLENFAIMSYVSFSKILKKHDKVSGYQTRSAFMSNVVNNATFTNYPKLLEMIHRCESLYDEVSTNLAKQGKTNSNLCEDERLFINMIQRLNVQIMDKAQAEGAPASSQRKQSMPMDMGKSNGISQSSSTSCEATSALQSLVEENDKTGSSRSICLSDDTSTDDSLSPSTSTSTLDSTSKPPSRSKFSGQKHKMDEELEEPKASTNSPSKRVKVQ